MQKHTLTGKLFKLWRYGTMCAGMAMHMFNRIDDNGVCFSSFVKSTTIHIVYLHSFVARTDSDDVTDGKNESINAIGCLQSRRTVAFVAIYWHETRKTLERLRCRIQMNRLSNAHRTHFHDYFRREATEKMHKRKKLSEQLPNTLKNDVNRRWKRHNWSMKKENAKTPELLDAATRSEPNSSSSCRRRIVAIEQKNFAMTFAIGWNSISFISQLERHNCVLRIRLSTTTDQNIRYWQIIGEWQSKWVRLVACHRSNIVVARSNQSAIRLSILFIFPNLRWKSTT